MSIWRRPIAVWFLVVFFVWAVGKDFQLMVTHKNSVDYFIFESNGLLQLFFLFMTVTFLLDFAGSFFLLQPSKMGFWICLSAVAVGLINNAVALHLALSDLSNVRDAYALSRELRGLPVREANLDRIFTAEGMQATFAIASLFAVVAGALIIVNRGYFFGAAQEAEEM